VTITISCPFDCEQEEHELEVGPEVYLGRLGWDGGIEKGEPLPCGNVPNPEQYEEIQQAIYERIIESAHPDP
jgi:hypothetical protein